jgi:surfactin synthase thioesterase subunit
LAFELAHNLPRSPQSLLLSGRQAPDCCLGQWKHTLSDRELIEELKAFGGTPPEILESPEILELILPVLRSDLKALDTYIFKKDRPLLTMDFLITCGRSDSLVPLASLQGWGKLTQGRVDTILWDGDHFYMQKDLSSYLNALRHWINHSLKVHVETREDMRKQA